MRPIYLIALLLFSPCVALAQFSSEVETRYVLTGIDGYEIVGDDVFVPEHAKPKRTAVGKLTIDGNWDSISIIADDADRQPIPTKQIKPNVFVVYGSGKVWVLAILARSDPFAISQERFEIEIGDKPEPDPDDDDPEPEPDPDVPPDAFDNIGQRVAKWSAGLENRKTIGVCYAEAAEQLRTDPSMTVNDVGNELVSKIAAIENFTDFKPLFDNLNPDIEERWPMARGVLADYYSAVAVGLGASQ